MRIFFISVIELNAGYGAEVFLNRNLLQLDHQTYTLDYRKHRAVLPRKFLEIPEFDVMLLQRGDYFPLPLVEACNRPRFFYSSELVSRCTDQHHLFQSNLFQHVFVRTPQCRETIIQRGWMKPEQITVFLSAFDEQTHRVIPGAAQDIDVLFVGSITPRRKAILDALRPFFSVVECQAFGDEMAQVFNRAKIALNLHAADHLDTETRVFEALGSGAFLISETLSPENPFQPVEHYIEVKTFDELKNQIRYYLDHPEERIRIAQQGHQEAVQKHTYYERARQICDTMIPFLSGTDASRPSLDTNRIHTYMQNIQSAESAPVQVVESTMNSNSLRIGIVTTWFERGAAYVSRQIRDVLQSKHEVFIYARGGEVSAEGNPQWDNERVTWAKKLPQNIPTSFDPNDFRQWIQTHRLNTILFNEQHWWPPVLGCIQLGLKIGSYVDYYTELTVPLFACYDFLLCNTQRHYSVFNWHPQAAYIPWGTEIDQFQPRSYAPVEAGQVTFFHSAGFNPYRKGTDFLLQAFAAVQGPARLIIHSQVSLSAHFPHLKDLIEPLIKAERLVVVEQTVPAPGLYHLGDVYVYPSRLEGIGLTMAEAMACGLPLITSNNGPMNEFHDEASGALVRLTRLFARHDGYYWPQCLVDVNHLRELMQTYVDQADRLEEKKRAARRFAEARLDWKKNAQALPDLINQFTVRPLRDKENAIRQVQLFEQRRQGH